MRKREVNKDGWGWGGDGEGGGGGEERQREREGGGGVGGNVAFFSSSLRLRAINCLCGGHRMNQKGGIRWKKEEGRMGRG